MEIQGKTAIVTGASRRVGRSLALAVATHGAKVALHYGSTSSADKAAGVVQEIERNGGQALAFQCDLREPTQIRKLMRDVDSHLGFCSVLINCAAVFSADVESGLDDTTAYWDWQLAVNLRAPYLLAREMLVHKPSGVAGKIINIGDAVRVRPKYVVYGTAKAGLSYLTRALALSMAPDVQVNEIALGYILPPKKSTSEPKNDSTQHFGRSPNALSELRLVPRNGMLEEVAKTLLALLDNDYITGETVRVDGGLHV